MYITLVRIFDHKKYNYALITQLMVQPRSFDAELYKIRNIVTVLLDGPRYDEKEQNSFNLIGLSTDTIKKVESNVWVQNLYEKYQPIIRLNKNSE